MKKKCYTNTLGLRERMLIASVPFVVKHALIPPLAHLI